MSSASPQAAANIAPRYAPRDRTTSVLRDVVRAHLRTLLEAGQDLDTGASHVPAFVQRELEAYLDCGDPAQGALRLVCVACRHTVFVPFTGHGRSFCPSCGARRMVELSEHLLEHVLPEQPLRQFVASLPFALRPIVGYHPPAFAAFARIFASEVARLQRRQARAGGVCVPLTGAIACLQRSGNALDLNPHLHLVALDGVFHEPRCCVASPDDAPASAELRSLSAQVVAEDDQTAPPPLVFMPLRAPTEDELVALSRATCRRLLAWLSAHGIVEAEALLPPPEAHVVAPLHDAARRVVSRFAQVDGDGQVYPVLEHVGGPRPQAGAHRGFSTHAGVTAPAHDRPRRERLLRYCLRPPLAEDAVRRTRDGRVAIELHHVRPSGATHVVFEPLGLLTKLAALVHPPAFHRARYFGVLASASKHRHRVVPRSPLALELPPLALQGSTGRVAAPAAPPTQPLTRRERGSWAALLRKKYGVDALRCPRCDGCLRLVALITDARVVLRILEHLARGHGPP